MTVRELIAALQKSPNLDVEVRLSDDPSEPRYAPTRGIENVETIHHANEVHRFSRIVVLS